MRHTKSTCAGCNTVFAGVEAFDMHRVGRYEPPERRCLTEAEMGARGMTQNDQGWWMLPVREVTGHPGRKSA